MKNLTNSFHIFLSCLLAFGFQACHKDDAHVKETLTKSPWTFAGDLFDQDGDGTFTEILEDCQKDDTWTFKNDDKLDILENDLKCDPDFSLDISIDWGLREDDAILVWLIGGDEEARFRIASLDDHTLVLHTIDEDEPNGPTYEKITLKR